MVVYVVVVVGVPSRVIVFRVFETVGVTPVGNPSTTMVCPAT